MKALPEQIEKEKAMYEENGYIDYSIYYQQYNQNMMAKYGQTNIKQSNMIAHGKSTFV